MKYLVLSDIHGNSAALRAILSGVDKARYDQLLVLGDSVGDGPCPDEVLSILSRENALCIQGNREQLASEHFAGLPATQSAMQWQFMRHSLSFLSTAQREEIAALPPERTVHDGTVSIRCVHGSPDSIRELLYASNLQKLQECLEKIDEEILLCGHSHHQFAYLYEDKLVLNPGSVGLSHAGEAFRADYGLLQVKGGQFSFELNHLSYDGSPMLDAYHDRALWEENIWGRLAWREMQEGKRYIIGFARHLFGCARLHKSVTQPISDEIWQEACRTWQWAPAE